MTENGYSRKESWWLGIIGGVFGWVAIASGVALVAGIVAALVFDKSWWIPVAFAFASWFFSLVAKSYHKEWKVSGGIENYSDTKEREE